MKAVLQLATSGVAATIIILISGAGLAFAGGSACFVPEPASIALFAVGAGAFIIARGFSRKK